MARTTLAELIGHVRTLIYDPEGTGEFYSDDDIQFQLDNTREDGKWIELEPWPTFEPSGHSTVYLDYYSSVTFWEADYVLQDMSFNDITDQTDLAEPMVGHWHFPTQVNGIGVRISGKIFDPYLASANLLDSWAAAVKMDYRLITGGDTHERQMKFDMMRKLAEEYRQRAYARTSFMTQSERNPQYDSPGVVYPSYRPYYGPGGSPEP